jgi:hypothetical protein
MHHQPGIKFQSVADKMNFEEFRKRTLTALEKIGT